MLGWLVVAALAVAVPLLVADHYGALGIPRSDDWSYLVTLFRLDDGDGLSFNHWVSMSLVGQLVLAAPVVLVAGQDITALQALTAVEGLAGLVCVGVAGSVALRARHGGLLVALTIVAGPLWAPLAATFMTDIPAFAVTALSFALACIAFTHRPATLGWVAAALAAALGAVTVRQYAAVTLLATGLAALWWYASTGDRRRARLVVALTAIALVLVAVFYAWWSSVPAVRALSPSTPDLHSAKVTFIKGAGFLRLMGLLLLPLLVAADPLTLVRRAWRCHRGLSVVAAAGSGLWLAGTAVRVPLDLFVGNYVSRDGVLSTAVLVGRRPDVFPRPFWWFLVALASAAAVTLVVALVPAAVAGWERIRARDWRLRDAVNGYLGLTLLGYGSAFALAALTSLQVYDRYVLLALPAAGVALLRAGEAARAAEAVEPTNEARAAAWWRPVGVGVALVLLAGLGFAFTADSASFDGARWRAAEAATRAGWKVSEVNGGFEWMNFHRRTKRVPRAERPPVCVTVRINPGRRDWEEIAVVESSAPTRATVPVIALRTTTPCPEPARP